ncbi:MAG: DoxX family protein [Proteobacteria bacterium]|nr:MAG: DoxX family protein [Pseudomonadota bacterium]
MKIAVIIIRVLLGLGFVIFGANILFPFLPQPPPVEGTPVAQFMAVVGPSGWMKLIGFFQLLGGLLVLSGRMAPLGLTILAGILINILAFHLFLDNGANLAPGLVFSAFEIFLIYAYRNYFAGIFTTNAKAP